MPVVLVLAASCTKNIAPDDASGDFNLTVTVPSVAATRATRPGEDPYNENLINSVYYFFYQKHTPATEETDAPKVYGFFAGLTRDDFDDNYSRTWSLPVSASTIVDKLFPSGFRTCRLIVVANPTRDIVSQLESGTLSISDLRKLVVTASLKGLQNNFVMVSDSEVQLRSRTDKISMHAEANMQRLADKITVNVEIAKVCKDSKGISWEPDLSAVKVAVCNGMSRTNLGGDFALLSATPGSGLSEDDYFESDEAGFNYEDAESKDAVAAEELPERWSMSSEAPFYTYPMEWEYTDKHEPYLLFEVPWKKQSAGTPGDDITCYYKLMPSFKSFGSNNWYDFTIQLKVLGSLFRDDPTQLFINEHYRVAPWKEAFQGSNNNVDADFKTSRYLVVASPADTLNAVTVHSIPFTSSHPCTYTVTDGYTWYINTSTGVRTKKTLTAAERDACFRMASVGNVLEFEHDLDNDITSDGIDVSEYVFEVEIRHTDDANFKQKVTIVQYPSIVIDSEANKTSRTTANVFVNGPLNTTTNGTGNPAAAYNAGNATFTYLYDSREQSKSMMYVIEVKALPSGSEYVLADPRYATPNYIDNIYPKKGTADDVYGHSSDNTADRSEHRIFDNTNTNCNYKTASGQNYLPGTPVAPAVDGTERQLTNYYATYTDVAHESFIAPKFRIASGFSSSGNIATTSGEKDTYHTYLAMVQRCAAYQEAGFPAGRWRLPTYAECMFVISLQNRGKIPELFTPGGRGYWCASCGLYYSSSDLHRASFGDYVNTSNTDKGQIRCVYDEWYWENTGTNRLPENKWGTFTWGDMPR